jgi:hypothetical protein
MTLQAANSLALAFVERMKEHGINFWIGRDGDLYAGRAGSGFPQEYVDHVRDHERAIKRILKRRISAKRRRAWK